MKRHKPKVLRCNVEMEVKDAGGKVLSTPTYCPDLQKIELYRFVGKGIYPHNYYFGYSVKYTVSDLRDGWYGNTNQTPSEEMDLRVPEYEDPDFIIEVKKVDCFKLILKTN